MGNNSREIKADVGEAAVIQKTCGLPAGSIIPRSGDRFVDQRACTARIWTRSWDIPQQTGGSLLTANQVQLNIREAFQCCSTGPKDCVDPCLTPFAIEELLETIAAHAVKTHNITRGQTRPALGVTHAFSLASTLVLQILVGRTSGVSLHMGGVLIQVCAYDERHTHLGCQIHCRSETSLWTRADYKDSLPQVAVV